MQELSMNVLDVAENSVAAGATLVAITLSIDTAAVHEIPYKIPQSVHILTSSITK